MIYNIEALRNMYKEYSNINQKISLETKKGNLTRIKSWYAYTTTLYSSLPTWKC